MNFKPTKYSLVCCANGHRFEDDGWTLADPTCTIPSLVRAEYENEAYVPQEHLEGLYRYSCWLPVTRMLKGSANPVTFKSIALAQELGLGFVAKNAALNGAMNLGVKALQIVFTLFLCWLMIRLSHKLIKTAVFSEVKRVMRMAFF